MSDRLDRLHAAGPIDELEFRSSFLVGPVLDGILVPAQVLVEIIGPAVHGKAAAGQQFSGHDRGVGVTKVRHHVCLPV